jgi:hypothetical protein
VATTRRSRCRRVPGGPVVGKKAASGARESKVEGGCARGGGGAT